MYDTDGGQGLTVVRGGGWRCPLLFYSSVVHGSRPPLIFIAKHSLFPSKIYIFQLATTYHPNRGDLFEPLSTVMMAVRKRDDNTRHFSRESVCARVRDEHGERAFPIASQRSRTQYVAAPHGHTRVGVRSRAAGVEEVMN